MGFGGGDKFCFIGEINRIMSTRPQRSVSRKGSQCMVMKREKQLNYIRCGILCVYLLPPHHRINPLPSNFIYQQPSFSCTGAQKNYSSQKFPREINNGKEINTSKCESIHRIVHIYVRILCFVDRASLYNRVNKANLVHSFS